MKSFFITLIFTASFLYSCNYEKSKQKELGIQSSDSFKNSEILVNDRTLPLKSIIELAEKHFRNYKIRLMTKNSEIGVQTVFTGDFNGDDKQDVLVYYDIEPTNGGGNYMMDQGLMLYENMGNDIKFITKYSPKYIFNFDTIRNSKIYIIKEEYAHEDPRCCPSIHSSMELTLKANKITEINLDQIEKENRWATFFKNFISAFNSKDKATLLQLTSNDFYGAEE